MKARGPFCIRHAAADTFAMVVFCFVTGMIIEIFVSGMTFQQSLASRTLSIPVNIAIAWPYGVFRDYVLRQGRKISPNLLDEKSLRSRGLRSLSIASLCRHSLHRRCFYRSNHYCCGHQCIGVVWNGGVVRLFPRYVPPLV